MFTTEEFRAFFEENGYTTLVDTFLETSHLKDADFMTYKVYKNWFFIARKNSSVPINITPDTVLKIKNPLVYQRKGILQEGEKQTEVTLELPGGTFTGAEPVIRILALVDGKNTYKDILQKLKEKGFTIDNEQEIKALLTGFVEQNILTLLS